MLSGLKVALAVAACYLAWAGWATHHHPVRTLAYSSSFFQGRQGGSEAISRFAPTANGTVGYDGQFFLYIALDPTGARPYLDNAAYRYGRPVYPLVARAVALGRATAIPWTLLLVGIASVVTATFALATLLGREGASPWYGALAGAYPGLFLGVSHDLSEPLAYALVAAGLLVLRRRTLLGSALLFALAGLTRETTLIFPVVIGVWLLLAERRRRDGAFLLGVPVVSWIALKAALAVWLGSFGTPAQAHVEPVPFLGLIRQWPWSDFHVQELLAVVFPALLAVGVVWWATRRVSLELCLLAANVLVLVLLLPKLSYVNYLASGRIAAGVIVAFVLCVPALLRSGAVAQLWLPVALWLLPWYSVLPEAVRR
jgi:hypothetical protein